MGRVMSAMTAAWRGFRGLPGLGQAAGGLVLLALVTPLALSVARDGDPDERRAEPAGDRLGRGPTGGGPPGGAQAPGSAQSEPDEVPDVRAPEGFQATTPQVTAFFNRALGGRGRAALDANQLLAVRCADGECLIEYIPDGPGLGHILEAQGVVWRALLEDPGWRAATMTAYPGDVRPREHGGPPRRRTRGGPPLLSVGCTRADVERIGASAWAAQNAPQVREHCRVTQHDIPNG
jgi:hypothetical protein